MTVWIIHRSLIDDDSVDHLTMLRLRLQWLSLFLLIQTVTLRVLVRRSGVGLRI